MAGTFTTGIAAMKTGRHCICIEQNLQCYEEAFNRIKSYLPTTAEILDHDCHIDDSETVDRGQSCAKILIHDDTIRHSRDESEHESQEKIGEEENQETIYPSFAILPIEDRTNKITELKLSQHSGDQSVSGCTTQPSADQSISGRAKQAICTAVNGNISDCVSQPSDIPKSSGDTTQDEAGLLLNIRNGENPTITKNIQDHNSNAAFQSSLSKRPLPTSFTENDTQPLKRTAKPLSIGLKRVTAPSLVTSINDFNSVVLFVGNRAVGTAIIQNKAGSSEQNTEYKSKFVSRLHGHDLFKWQKDNETLVVIYKVKIVEKYGKLENPYSFEVGVEGLPKTLGELSASGFYVWDLNKTNYLITP